MLCESLMKPTPRTAHERIERIERGSSLYSSVLNAEKAIARLLAGWQRGARAEGPTCRSANQPKVRLPARDHLQGVSGGMKPSISFPSGQIR